MLESWRKLGQPLGETWIWKVVRKVCVAAKTRIVCPHGLRDTYSTIIAALSGAAAPDIGRLLGHADAGRTARRHYIGEPEHRKALKLVS